MALLDRKQDLKSTGIKHTFLFNYHLQQLAAYLIFAFLMM